MYPDNQPTQSSLDYLNQIAVQAPKKKPFFINKLVLIGGGLTIAVVIAIIIANVISSGIKPIERLAARLVATSGIVDDSTSKVQSSQLRTFNGNLKIYLTNTIRDITPILTKQNININKLNPKATSAESNTSTLATLEDARLNAVYDRTYAREMSYKLATIIALIRQISGSTGNKDLKTFLDNADTNLDPIQKQFSDFNAANS